MDLLTRSMIRLARALEVRFARVVLRTAVRTRAWRLLRFTRTLRR